MPVTSMAHGIACPPMEIKQQWQWNIVFLSKCIFASQKMFILISADGQRTSFLGYANDRHNFSQVLFLAFYKISAPLHLKSTWKKLCPSFSWPIVFSVHPWKSSNIGNGTSFSWRHIASINNCMSVINSYKNMLHEY